MAKSMAAKRTEKKTDIAFNGFSKQAFGFFKNIEFYQSKEWYLENKYVYETQALQPMISLLGEMNREMKELGLPLAGDPKTSLFRIHRDIRFSKDKTPYRTHIGATLSRDGRKLSPGMLYIHVSPEDSFLAMGTYHPAPDELGGIREAIVKKSKRWLDIIQELSDAGLELSNREMLKRMPRGYDEYVDKPIAESLKQRSFVVRRALPQASLSSRKLIKEIVKFVDVGKKFLEFQWAAVDQKRKDG